MRSDLTDVTIVLDRSGSMASVRDDTIGGFNTFIEEQAKLSGECWITLRQFDDVHETVYPARPVKDVPKLSATTYVPRASTALLDAMGMAITATGERLAAMNEKDRPEKVIVVIITDGFENASKTWTREQVNDLIRQQREVYQWDFVFLGANQDAIAEGAKYGIDRGKSMSVAHSEIGTRSAYDSLSSYVGTARGMSVGELQNVGFSAQDRQKQRDEGAAP